MMLLVSILNRWLILSPTLIKKYRGQKGEQVAAAYLRKKGYVILHRNWRCRAGEADIIACKGDTLLIGEVKTRNAQYKDIFLPHDTISSQKLQRLEYLADLYQKIFAQKLSRYRIRQIKVQLLYVLCTQKRSTLLPRLSDAHYSVQEYSL
jgi:putative endonuclease